MEDNKLQFLKMHTCAEDLEDEVLRDIASYSKLLHFEPGDVIHDAKSIPSSVYLVVQGRIKTSGMDVYGKIFMEQILSRGDQFGALSAALVEPVPIQVVSYEPSVILKFKYQDIVKLSLKYPQFLNNISNQLAQDAKKTLFGAKPLNKKASLVAIYHESPVSRELTIRLIRRLQELGERPALLTDQSTPPKIAGVRCRSLLENGTALSIERIRAQVHAWSDANRFFIDLSVSNSVETLLHVLEFCEHVFWCVAPDQWDTARNNLKLIKDQTPAWREKISVVWMLDAQQQRVPVVPELKELSLEDFKLSLEEPGSLQSRILSNGIERLVHRLRGISIGVALGGGAARGMAHLGVLKALENQGIVVDMIAGTSAGAMTGTLLAAGIDFDYCTKSFVHDLTPSRLFRLFPKGDQWSLLYNYRFGKFDPMLRKYLDDLRLEQLPMQIHTVTVDLVSGEPVIRSTGDAVHAILESINLPGLSLPICRNGRALVDGGIVNNVPANVLVDKGCNFVIAVSVTAKLESCFGKNYPNTPTEKMKTPSTLQTFMRSQVVQSMNMNSHGVQPADIVIEPDVTGFELTEFKRTDELAAVGEEATLAAIPEIKDLINKLDKMF